jgi:uncharacterized protein
MEWEFDESKSHANKQKHGIDFHTSQKLWSDPNRIEVPARTEDEPRFLLIGQLNKQYWSVVFTPRGSRIRIISARRSRKEEIELYEGKGIR